MEVVAWAFVIGAILFAIVGFVRSFFAEPDADVQATRTRIAQRRRETELVAERAAQRAAEDAEREFP